MVQTIKECQNIQYGILDEKRWLYNIINDRMVVSKQPLETYLEEINEPSNPLYDFYHSSYKRGTMMNFHLFRVIWDSSKIDFFHKTTLFLINKYLIFVMMMLNVLYLPQFIDKSSLSAEQFSLNQLPIFELIAIYFTMVAVILPLHEYAHFSVYYKYFQPPKITFGFAIRYFSMPVFFIKVPFYKLLSNKKKNELIMAGIKFQVVIWFLLSVIHMVSPSSFVSSMLVVNIGLITTNLLPFLKLDGYWYISNILKVDDYMGYFKNMFLKKVAFRLDIFILGILNYFLIILSLFGFNYDIVKIFI